MWPNRDYQIEVAFSSAVVRLPLAGHAHPGAIRDPGWYLHLNSLQAWHHAGAAAGRTREILYPTGPTTGRTRLASFHTQDAAGPLVGFLQRYFHRLFDIQTAPRPTAPPGSPAAKGTKEVAEQALEVTFLELKVLPPALPELPERRLLGASFGELVGILPLVAVAVILFPFFLIGQYFVSPIDFLEPGLGVLVAGVDIRMKFPGQPTVGLFYLLFCGAPLYTQNVVIILTSHVSSRKFKNHVASYLY